MATRLLSELSRDGKDRVARWWLATGKTIWQGGKDVADQALRRSRMAGRVVRREYRRGLTKTGLIAFFVLGVCGGVLIKASAKQVFTMGYDDYRLPKPGTTVDLNAVQRTVLRGGGSLAVSEGALPTGAMCLRDEPSSLQP